MSQQKKQSSAKDNAIFGLQGLLIGGAGMATIETLRLLKSLLDKKTSQPSNTTMEQITLSRGKEGEDEELVKQSNAWYEDFKEVPGLAGDFISGPFKALKEIPGSLLDTAKDFVDKTGAGDATKDMWLRNSLLLGGLGAGAWGVSELFDNHQKGQAQKDTDRLKRYYYARLMDYHKRMGTDASTERTPLSRKEAMEKRAAPGFVETLLFGLTLGVPVAGMYVVKKYLDETLPGSKQPSAKPSKDPRNQVSRVRNIEEDQDEDPTIKIFEGIGKSAALSPHKERAWETAHLLRTLNATKEASNTILPDILRTMVSGGRKGMHKYALDGDLDGFINFVEKRASQSNRELTPQEAHIAADMVGADHLVRGMTMPIVCGEALEQFPTAIKIASTIPKSYAKASLAVAKAITLSHEEELFPNTLEKRASAQNFKPLTLSQLVKANEKIIT